MNQWSIFTNAFLFRSCAGTGTGKSGSVVMRAAKYTNTKTVVVVNIPVVVVSTLESL